MCVCIQLKSNQKNKQKKESEHLRRIEDLLFSQVGFRWPREEVLAHQHQIPRDQEGRYGEWIHSYSKLVLAFFAAITGFHLAINSKGKSKEKFITHYFTLSFHFLFVFPPSPLLLLLPTRINDFKSKWKMRSKRY